ncbi:MAG: DUF1549 domain-containing protein [Rubripirellula sp.]
MNSEHRSWRQATSILIATLCVLHSGLLLHSPAWGDGGQRKSRQEKKAKNHQERLEKRRKKQQENNQTEETTQGQQQQSNSPVKRKITDEQVSIAAAKIDALVIANLKQHNLKPAPPADELVLLRRIYLDVTGRIPTANEMDRFLSNRNPDRLNNLIEELLDSAGHRSHLFNYFADMLRISDDFYRVGATHSYQSWLKKQIRENRPWDAMVSEMMTAEGPFGNNGATGYLLRDAGMPLDSLSNTLTTFMGANVACAQCHDHPFADWSQDDFYQMAAFFGSTRFEREDSRKPARSIATEEFKKSTLVTLLQPNLSRVVFEKGRSLKYPEDYQYDDELPGKKVTAKFITWEDTPTVPVAANTSSPKTLRTQFANWMTAKGNPRFASAIANRMWKRFFGAAVQEPITDLDQKELATNPELLSFLSTLMCAVDFDLREFQRVLLRTNIYRLQACPTPDEGIPFRFPGPMLRRMTAEQVWDSIVILNSGTEPEEYVRDLGHEIAELVIPSFVIPKEKEVWNAEQREQVFAHARDVLMKRGVSPDQMAAGGRGVFSTKEKRRGVNWIRASELAQPTRPDHLLRIAGQSDRSVPDDSATEGGIAESLAMMNGEAADAVVGTESLVMRQAALRSQHADKVNFLYRSFLTRNPSKAEKQICAKVFDLRMGITDIAWALLNSREFMFIQ